MNNILMTFKASRQKSIPQKSTRVKKKTSLSAAYNINILIMNARSVFV